MVTSLPPIAANRGDATSQGQSMLYKAVMTPIIFVTFLASLVLVDLSYSIKRSHLHPEEYSSRLPHWLHRIIYRYQPYQYVQVDRDGNPIRDSAYQGFYHSKQRKLMKMEVDDAFQIRGTVLFVMGILAMISAWSLWRLATWMLRSIL
ncbi:hypothetical protein BR93DRAFT_292298 [Coniochaeta sp. PMI_546]|nr:hypothetical protein BR93DRAFT_292298 [Coniochaeta sp. PMI_546]